MAVAANLHRQVRIEHDGTRADVDAGMASLILALWKRGIRTCSSCVAFPAVGGRPYVGFPSRADADAFLALIPSRKVYATAEVDPALDGVDEWTPPGTVMVALRGGVPVLRESAHLQRDTKS